MFTELNYARYRISCGPTALCCLIYYSEQTYARENYDVEVYAIFFPSPFLLQVFVCVHMFCTRDTNNVRKVLSFFFSMLAQCIPLHKLVGKIVIVFSSQINFLNLCFCFFYSAHLSVALFQNCSLSVFMKTFPRKVSTSYVRILSINVHCGHENGLTRTL